MWQALQAERARENTGDADDAETAALRKRVAELEADKARLDAKLSEQAAEIAGLRQVRACSSVLPHSPG